MNGRPVLLATAGFALFLLVGINQGLNGFVGSVLLTAATRTHSTNFPRVENPLSEGGAWHHLDPTLTFVRVESIGGVNVAHGTQTGDGGYDDSNAYLSGFSENHSIEGTVWMSPSITSSPNREVELLLRWRDDNPQRDTPYGPTSVTGYEININQNGNYLNLGTFKGPLLVAASAPPRPRNGDIFKAEINSNSDGSATIVVWWNGVEKIRYRHANPVRGGNPGIGFYIRSGAPNNEYGFTRVTATDTGSGLPSPPTNLRIVPST